MATLDVPEDAVARIIFFSAADCEHCRTVYRDVVAPLQARCGSSLEVKLIDVATDEGLEAFVAVEAALIGEAGRWDVPVVVVEDTDMVGESSIRQELVPHLECVFGAGGNAWPDVTSLDLVAPATQVPTVVGDSPPRVGEGGDPASCLTDEVSAVCESSDPMFVLYVTPADCADNCDRTRYDLRYLQGVYPQMVFEEQNATDSRELLWTVGEFLDIPTEDRTSAPAVFVGNDYLLGDDVTLGNLREILLEYAESGAIAFWYTLDLPE